MSKPTVETRIQAHDDLTSAVSHAVHEALTSGLTAAEVAMTLARIQQILEDEEECDAC